MESRKGFFRGSNNVPFQELVSLSSNHIPRERVEEVRFFLFDGEWIERWTKKLVVLEDVWGIS